MFCGEKNGVWCALFRIMLHTQSMMYDQLYLWIHCISDINSSYILVTCLQLLSGLPPVPEILRLSGVCLDEALVPAAASLTVPRATPRATFNQGVQVIHVLL